MAISELYTNSATIGTTEYSLPNNSTTLASITTDGAVQVLIDFANMTSTEGYTIKIKEKVTSGGTQRTVVESRLDGAQPGPWVSPVFIMMHGWDVTVTKNAGTDRSISWSIRKAG